MSAFNHHEPAAPIRLLPELLDLIATELYRETGTDEHVAACSLVCKDFEASFRPFVFRDTNIRDVGILRRLATLLRSSPHIGAYVRILSIFSTCSWKDWEEDFSTVAHRLIHLQDLTFWIEDEETLVDHTDIFRRAIACILSYPSIRSMSLHGEIVFAISPRLLLAFLENIDIVADYEPDYDLEYWENLNAAYVNLLDPSTAKECLEAPTRCISLSYSWPYTPTPVWLVCVPAVQPTAFANLTTLMVYFVRDLPKLQTVLTLAGAALQILIVTSEFWTEGSSDHLPLDLSHNTGLQELKLEYYSAISDGYVARHVPQKGLSGIEASLKSVNAPSLREVHIGIRDIECCGGQSLQQSPHLRRFDACFADFSQRHPGFRQLELNIEFEHYPTCKNNVTCIQSPLNSPSDRQNALTGHFPFLTTKKPAHLKVIWFDLS